MGIKEDWSQDLQSFLRVLNNKCMQAKLVRKLLTTLKKILSNEEAQKSLPN